MKAPNMVSVAILMLGLHGYALGAEAATEIQWVMTLGCRHCHFSEQTGIKTCQGNCGPAAMKDGKVFMLSGSAVPKDYKKSGEWLIKGTLSADGKAIAVQEMTLRVPTPEELKESQPAGAAADAKPHTGAVTHTSTGLPTLTAADKTLYGLKPSKTASTATKYTLTRIGGGDLTGEFTATGATYEDDRHTWIVVDSIQAMEGSPRR